MIMAEQIAKMYTLIGYDGRYIKHRGRPSKKFMERNAHIKGYNLTYIMGCERIEETYLYENKEFNLKRTQVSEWKW